MTRTRPVLWIALIGLLATGAWSYLPSSWGENLDLSASTGDVFIVPINGMIDNGLATYLDRAVSDAEEAGASVILFDVDTFGGLVDAADQIRKTILNTELPTLAFVNSNAASAGALISLAADRIVMVPGAAIGAATVVEGDSGEQAPDKYQSYMRGLMRATASANGRNPEIAESMVDASVVIEGVIEEGKVLTLTAIEAEELGIADAVIETRDEVIRQMGLTERSTIQHAASPLERFLRFLGSPILQSLFMVMMMSGLYFELQSPGVGFAGMMALVGGLAFFAPSYLLGLAESWEILLFILGVILLAVEIFVTPGFGLFGIGGLILMIGSLVFGMIGNTGLQLPSDGQVGRAMLTVGTSFVLMIFVAIALGRYLPKTQAFNRLILKPELSSELGYTAVDARTDLVGATGLALTDLRPSGSAEFEGDRVDVITAGEYIPMSTAVRVTKVEGSRVVVRPVTRITPGAA